MTHRRLHHLSERAIETVKARDIVPGDVIVEGGNSILVTFAYLDEAGIDGRPLAKVEAPDYRGLAWPADFPVAVVANDREAMIDAATEILLRYGQVDGDHHKAWVIDQVLRCLRGRRYAATVEAYEEDGEYEWDRGTPP